MRICIKREFSDHPFAEGQEAGAWRKENFKRGDAGEDGRRIEGSGRGRRNLVRENPRTRTRIAAWWIDELPEAHGETTVEWRAQQTLRLMSVNPDVRGSPRQPGGTSCAPAARSGA